ncbi:ATPase, T2SS/T4P/T4SS family [Lacticaseibacillus kribbianus]|uniref:ATPase, T2SS/T4P/T4SS family n=1 Tax=Lacticaseibacillus kribbianus TaxID=2926292 RepID=UPI001CD7B94B|nr:ATPase, T2SS/T4P/T4SS family [Lacticaseibacillus kribbianus]
MDLLMALLRQAVAAWASDLYLLPKPSGYEVIMRTSAGLEVLRTVPQAEGQRWLNFLKYQAGMNVSEHRRVQLGAVVLEGLATPLRLSTVADHAGLETLVVRFLHGVPPLDAGSRPVVERLLGLASRRGLIALSGPTGSGKTTLLYQVARELSATQMVMTIEDPVEIVEPQFLQLQVNPEAEMSYAALLKAALRHRPDVLLIGEVRDFETAQQACEAAISGHLVLTTVHARTADLVPLRLQALGVAPSLVAAALTAAGAVRLVQAPAPHPVVTIAVFDRGAAS